MSQFTAVMMVYDEGSEGRAAFIRVEAASPLKAISAAADQIREDYGDGCSYMTLAIIEGWPRDFLNPAYDQPDVTGEWEEELDQYFLGEGLNWQPTRRI